MKKTLFLKTTKSTEMKTILITGANGQLGNEMRNVLAENDKFKVFYTDYQELDVTSEMAVNAFFDSNEIDYLVNCVAYTAVDNAEEDVERCKTLNADAPAILAEACNQHNVKMVHVSTDYVFNGLSCTPYVESDDTCPTSVYGSTKLEGEKNAQKILPDVVILRTAWLYSPYGKNFVKTMLNLGRTKDSLKVVFDQVGSPTYAYDLAKAIMTVIDAEEWHAGIYHFSNEGVISWYDFTKAIHRIAGITTCNVIPCKSDEFPAKASRPHYSVFDKTKFKNTFGVDIPYWEESLKTCIKRLELQ